MIWLCILYEWYEMRVERTQVFGGEMERRKENIY
jgi:hypothetical protein